MQRKFYFICVFTDRDVIEVHSQAETDKTKASSQPFSPKHLGQLKIEFVTLLNIADSPAGESVRRSYNRACPVAEVVIL